jgi:hypothetical protein
MFQLQRVRSGGRRRASIARRFSVESLESRALLAVNPSVLAVAPLNQSMNMPVGSNLIANFNTPLNPSTVNATNVILKDQNGNPVPMTVSYSSTNNSVQVTPSVALQQMGTFTETIKGGASGVLGTNGLPMTSDYSWSFSTAMFGSSMSSMSSMATPGVSIDRTSGLLTNAAGGQAVFDVVLNSMPAANVTIPVTSSNTNAGFPSTANLTFTPSNWNTPQAVIVSGKVSSTASANTSYSINLGTVSSTDPAYNGIKPGSVSLVNLPVNTRPLLEAAAVSEAARFAYSSMYEAAMPMPQMSACMTGSMDNTQANVLALVPVSSVTNMVIQSGNWSNPAIWSNQQVPAAGANVWVMPGRTLTVDGVIAPSLHTIRVSGTLNFATSKNTGLSVDTIEVDPMGSFVMGTTQAPIAAGVTANVVFTDSGPIDRVWDPYGFSRGLLCQGSASIVGAAKNGSIPLATIPAVGATTIVLTKAPLGWKVGDVIDIPGTSGGSDEQFTIKSFSADRLTITLNVPVALARNASQAGMSIEVSNLTRNINFSSQNTSDYTRRGHVMFMHNNNVLSEYAAFNGLGRTNWSLPINNAVVDQNGLLVPGTGTNPKGRYAFHIHMAGTDMPMNPILVLGNVVNDSASWGYDNHSSNVDFEDNIAYNTKEAGFATEMGDEIGTFNCNVAIYGGHVGFWLNGPYVTFTNNVASGFNANYGDGVEVWAYTNVDASGSLVFFNTAKMTVQGGQTPIDPWLPAGQLRIELLPFHLVNTQVFNSWGGIEVRGHQQDLGQNYRSTIDGGAIWGVQRGLTFNYSTGMTVNNTYIYGDGQFDHSGIFGDSGPRDLVFNNITDVDWGTGITFPVSASIQVNGGFFNNTVNFRIPTFDPGTTPGLASRSISISGVSYGTSLKPSLLIPSPNSTPYNIYLDNTALDPSTPLKRFMSDQILYNGHQLFFNDQASTFIVTGTGITNYDGLTNAQLFSAYGITTRGIIMPSAATADPTIYGGTIY